MKKYILSILVLTALYSCTADDLGLQVENTDTDKMTFIAVRDVQEDDSMALTRASFNNYNILWEADDAISVFSGAKLSENKKMTLKSGAGKTSASFVGDCEKGTEYFAIYPYNPDNLCEGNNDWGFTVNWNGYEQIAAKDSYDPSTPMVAKVENVYKSNVAVPLPFKNIFSYVKVTTDYKCKSITLTSKSQPIGAGKIYIRYDDNGNPKIHTYGAASQSVTLKGKDDASIEPGTYYIAVMPTQIEGLELTINGAYGDKKYTKSSANTLNLERNKITNLGSFQLRGTDLEMLEGEGSEANPYKIKDMEDLITMQRWVTAEKGDTWKKFYQQTADIDAQGREMAPIGTADHRFWGVYDGGGHYIKNMCYKGTFGYYVPGESEKYKHNVSALFGAIKNATICNLTIVDPIFHEDNKCVNLTVSPLVGVAYGKGDLEYHNRIISCRVTGKCTINNIVDDYKEYDSDNWMAFRYGGLVADCQASIFIGYCLTDVELTINRGGDINTKACSAIGGYIGTAYGVNQTNSNSLEDDGMVELYCCRNSSPKITYNQKRTLVAPDVNIGGIIGYAHDFTWDDDVVCLFDDVINNANIEVKSEDSYTNCSTNVYIGGLIGYNDADGPAGGGDPLFYNCINNGNLTTVDCSNVYMGGLNGKNYDDDSGFYYCANTGTLTTNCSKKPGAICYQNGYFKECYNCKESYSICIESAGSCTNTGQKTIDQVIDYMNQTSFIRENLCFQNWRKQVFDGRDIADLQFGNCYYYSPTEILDGLGTVEPIWGEVDDTEGGFQ